MVSRYDTIIVGSGIAGLLTALRLSQQGQKVLVVERDKIGSGATGSNHGMVHSGALFIRRHAHIIRSCQEAQKLFLNLAPDAEVKTRNSIYVCPKDEMGEFTGLLKRYGLDHNEIQATSVPEIYPKISKRYGYIHIRERVFSSATILKTITSYCLANKIEFLLGSKVSEIVVDNNKVKGVKIGPTQVLCRNVIIATGLGTLRLLESFNSYYCKFLKSRLDMMVYLPKTNLTRGLVFAEINRPVIMPAKDGGALASFFGGVQPPIVEDRKFSVDFDKAQLLLKTITRFFNKDIVNIENSMFYMSGKTDFVGDDHTEKGFINPGFHIIDHSKFDEVEGLYTIATGKMVLAFHASKAAADLVLGTGIDLFIARPTRRVDPPVEMFAIEPWLNSDGV